MREVSVEFCVKHGRPANSVLIYPFAEVLAKVLITGDYAGDLLHILAATKSRARVIALK